MFFVQRTTRKCGASAGDCGVSLAPPFFGYNAQHLHSLRFNCLLHWLWVCCDSLCGTLSARKVNKRRYRVCYDRSGRRALFAAHYSARHSFALFNVLLIQGALLRPSRDRMQCVVNGAVLACFVLMYSFGLRGLSLWPWQIPKETFCSVVTDESNNDLLFLVGRIGCGVIVLLATRMMFFALSRVHTGDYRRYVLWSDKKREIIILWSRRGTNVPLVARTDSTRLGLYQPILALRQHVCHYYRLLYWCSSGTGCGHCMEPLWLEYGLSDCLHSSVCLLSVDSKKETY